MLYVLLCVTLLLLVDGGVIAISSVIPNDPVIDLGYARYRGIKNVTSGVTSYRGLRYATAPIGALRWQPPIGIERASEAESNNVTDATTFGPRCYQIVPFWQAAPDGSPSTANTATLPTSMTSEDCLRLDVLVPNSPRSSRLPVVVQIHGGGYTQGRSNSSDGSEFVRHSDGSIIYVQIQYRLGPYGFLAAPAVRANGTANAGLLDQHEALAWVQRNIGKFGGDVTIWGGSAGGGSVAFQLILHGGDPSPPYRAAIPEFPWWQTFKDDTILTTQYEELLQSSGCSDLGCLRDLDSAALYNASQQAMFIGYETGNYGYGDYYYGPAVDGISILSLPSNEYAQGHFAQVSMLINHDAFEGFGFTNFSLTQANQVQPDLQKIWHLANQTFLDQVFEQYPLSVFSDDYFTTDPIITTYGSTYPSTTNNSAFYQRQTIFGDYIVNCPTWYMASALATSGLPVYKLRFAAGTETHAATGDFLYKSYNDSTIRIPNATLSDWMKDYWLSFILTGDPNSNVDFSRSSNANKNGSRPIWPAYDQGNGSYVVLNINQTAVGSGLDYDAGSRCQFFRENTEVVRN